MKNIISTTDAPAAIGPYSQAIEINGFLFTSGDNCLNLDQYIFWKTGNFHT